MDKAPCKECTERHMGCHSECEGYLKFAEERAKLREARHKKNEEIYHARKSMERSTKKKGGQK